MHIELRCIRCLQLELIANKFAWNAQTNQNDSRARKIAAHWTTGEALRLHVCLASECYDLSQDQCAVFVSKLQCHILRFQVVSSAPLYAKAPNSVRKAGHHIESKNNAA